MKNGARFTRLCWQVAVQIECAVVCRDIMKCWGWMSPWQKCAPRPAADRLVTAVLERSTAIKSFRYFTLLTEPNSSFCFTWIWVCYKMNTLQCAQLQSAPVTKCTYYNVHSYSVHMLQCTHVTTKLPITYPASMYHWTHLNRPSPPYTWRWHHVHPQFCFVAWTPMLPFHKPDRFSITAL